MTTVCYDVTSSQWRYLSAVNTYDHAYVVYRKLFRQSEEAYREYTTSTVCQVNRGTVSCRGSRPLHTTSLCDGGYSLRSSDFTRTLNVTHWVESPRQSEPNQVVLTFSNSANSVYSKHIFVTTDILNIFNVCVSCPQMPYSY